MTQIVALGNDVWFGTFDHGLLCYNKRTQLEQFTRADGLSHNRVLDITTDEDYLWIGTARGLSRYDTITDTWTILLGISIRKKIGSKFAAKLPKEYRFEASDSWKDGKAKDFLPHRSERGTSPDRMTGLPRF